MPQPINDAPPGFPSGKLTSFPCLLDSSLIKLLIDARQQYDWPAGTGAKVSQARIIALEAAVCRHIASLSPASANCIAISVSDWAGNNAVSHGNIVHATAAQQRSMQSAILLMLDPLTAGQGIDELSALPGISLVIASKIYRFCAPSAGAAVDRHSSYFFNSLKTIGGYATDFRREWSNGGHTASRLAIYQKSGYKHNHTQYFTAYIPILRCIADSLNANGRSFICAATGATKAWTPADVEMAAYYWWACNGPR